MTTLHDIIMQDAEYCKNVQVTVNSCYGTVSIIDCDGEQEEIFLQGDDACQFISEAERLWDNLETITRQDAYAHLAKPYVDSYWN